MATSNGPCLRASHGSVPVSAKLTAARLPASRTALAKIIEPKVAGGRNTTCPSIRCGASSPAISCCAKRGLAAQNRLRLRRSRCRRRAPRSSMGPSLRGGGLVSLPQHEMLNLAQGRSRQIVDKNDVARHLEAGKLLQHVRLQILRLDRTARPSDDIGDRYFLPFGIW